MQYSQLLEQESLPPLVENSFTFRRLPHLSMSLSLTNLSKPSAGRTSDICLVKTKENMKRTNTFQAAFWIVPSEAEVGSPGNITLSASEKCSTTEVWAPPVEKLVAVALHYMVLYPGLDLFTLNSGTFCSESRYTDKKEWGTLYWWALVSTACH